MIDSIIVAGKEAIVAGMIKHAPSRPRTGKRNSLAANCENFYLPVFENESLEEALGSSSASSQVPVEKVNIKLFQMDSSMKKGNPKEIEQISEVRKHCNAWLWLRNALTAGNGLSSTPAQALQCLPAASLPICFFSVFLASWPRLHSPGVSKKSRCRWPKLASGSPVPSSLLANETHIPCLSTC